MRFTFKAYNDLLESLIFNGYGIANYHNYTKITRPCILRHDVDMDLEKAAVFSEFENSIGEGITSTYFVLMNTNFYNLYSKINRERLKRILKGGHEIGLHFDEMQYDLNDDSELISEYISQEVEDLSNIIGEKVRTVSMHRPSKKFLNVASEFSDSLGGGSKQLFQGVFQRF